MRDVSEDAGNVDGDIGHGWLGRVPSPNHDVAESPSAATRALMRELCLLSFQ